MLIGGEIILDECPLTYITPLSNYYLGLFWDCHNFSQDNIICHALPDDGGILDQDNKTMDAFILIRSEFDAHQKDLRKKDEK